MQWSTPHQVAHPVPAVELEDSGDEDEALEDRRFTEDSARTLARILFSRYDDNRSGYLNSTETSTLITDFYCSLNIDHPSTKKEGFDFMVANDVNNDGEFSVKDFEDIFVHHLSTGNNTSGYKLFSDKKVASVKAEFDAPKAAETSTVVGQQPGQIQEKTRTETQAPEDPEIRKQTEKGRTQGDCKGETDGIEAAKLLLENPTLSYDDGYKLGIEKGHEQAMKEAAKINEEENTNKENSSKVDLSTQPQNPSQGQGAQPKADAEKELPQPANPVKVPEVQHQS